jgi:hypothetical protein
MPRIPKRLVALGGLMAAGGMAFKRLRGGRSQSAPAPAPASGPTPPVSAQPPVTPVAPPPTETPGPSVTPPAAAQSETERAETADATTPDTEILERQAGGPVDELVEQETAAAAAEAGSIGGPHYETVAGTPAMDPVYEAGGGDAEGFEQAEADLIENATHGGGAGDPSRDAFTPEVEADESTAIAGEADDEKVSEVTEDVPEAETKDADTSDDPGSGPGITHER